MPDSGHVVSVSRMLTLTPDTPVNVDRFIKKYQQDKRCFVAPGDIASANDLPFDNTLTIVSTNVVVREAWQIDEHDPDGVGILLEDDVVVPEGVADPPVLRTLACTRERAHKSRK